MLALAGLVVAVGAAGCMPQGGTGNTSDETPAAGVTSQSSSSSKDPGCTSALGDISQYGPSTVKLLADGREAVGKAAVSLLVEGLDNAADAANSPQTKQAIQTLANAYVDYFDLTTDAVSIPLSLLLKDTTDLEFICR